MAFQPSITRQIALEALYRPTKGAPGPADTDAVVFDDSVPGTNSNIRENRAANQSAIDNTKTGITNLGSDTTGAALGSTGNYSTIGGGDQNSATGDYSTVAGGFQCTASGAAAHAEGGMTTASGGGAHAEGNLTVASAASAHAEGQSTLASGPLAHAEGSITTSSGAASHSEGTQTLASADSAHAEGSNTIASATNAHAEGHSTQALGNGSHTEGSGTVANAANSHAEGSITTTNGEAAHAEGDQSTANGNSSHAEGTATTANGNFSHAEGESTISNGSASHAGGVQSNSLRESQDAFASGMFTVPGDAQTSSLVLRGLTPGSAPNESVELHFGFADNQTFQLEDGKAYSIRVEAAARSAAGDFASYVQTIAATQTGGVIAPLVQGVQEVLASGGAGGWSLTQAIAAAPERIAFTFNTGIAVAAVHVACTIRFTEVSG